MMQPELRRLCACLQGVCPECGTTNFTYFGALTDQIMEHVTCRMAMLMRTHTSPHDALSDVCRQADENAAALRCR